MVRALVGRLVEWGELFTLATCYTWALSLPQVSKGDCCHFTGVKVAESFARGLCILTHFIHPVSSFPFFFSLLLGSY